MTERFANTDKKRFKKTTQTTTCQSAAGADGDNKNTHTENTAAWHMASYLSASAADHRVVGEVVDWLSAATPPPPPPPNRPTPPPPSSNLSSHVYTSLGTRRRNEPSSGFETLDNSTRCFDSSCARIFKSALTEKDFQGRKVL